MLNIDNENFRTVDDFDGYIHENYPAKRYQVKFVRSKCMMPERAEELKKELINIVENYKWVSESSEFNRVEEIMKEFIDFATDSKVIKTVNEIEGE